MMVKPRLVRRRRLVGEARGSRQPDARKLFNWDTPDQTNPLPQHGVGA
jgi:hypothetical protein